MGNESLDLEISLFTHSIFYPPLPTPKSAFPTRYSYLTFDQHFFIMNQSENQ
jgi:hypothetical protein